MSSLQYFTMHLKKSLVADTMTPLKMHGEILQAACQELLLMMNNYLFDMH